MAFVYEVERPPLFNIKKATSEIGPGQYLPLTLYKFEKPNPVPFGAAAKRGSLFKLNQFPGPGAYNPKEDQNISHQIKPTVFDEINNNKNKNKNKSYQMKQSKIQIISKKNNEIIEKYRNKENYGFYTKVGRFIDYNKLNTPGPGTYDDKNILLAKSIEEKCTNNKDKIYKINKGRHNVYSVNRFDRQFPWNSEVIGGKNKKKKKNKSVDNIKVIKNIEQENKSIIISKINKENNNLRDEFVNQNNFASNNYKLNKSKEEKLKRKIIVKKDENILGKYNDKNLVTFSNNTEKQLSNINSKLNSEGQSIINNKDNKYIKKEKNENNIPLYKKILPLKKSKTSSDFFIPKKDIKINKSKKAPILSKKEAKEKLKMELKFNKLPNEMKYRISSIPSKFTAGYEIEKESGKVVRRQMKTYFKIFSGEKNDAVGPGSYELDLANEWRKTGTSWSKYLVKKDSLKLRPKSGLSNSCENRDIINFNKLDKDFKKIVKNGQNIYENTDLYPKFNINTPNLYKFYSTQHVFFHPTSYNIKVMNNTIKKDKLPDFIPVNDVPGPGYYYDEEKINQNSNKGKLKNAHLYDEDIQLEYDDDGGLGPGTYFHDIFNLDNKNREQKNKKGDLSGQKSKSVPFLCTSKRFSYKTPQNENQIGSNVDEQYINGIKKMISNNDNTMESSNTSNSTHKFGFSFRDKFINENDNNSMSKTFSSKNKYKSMTGTFYRRDMRFRENVLEENRKKEIPGPGSYINPYTSTGKTNSIKVDGRYMDIRSCRVLLEKNRANKFDKNKKIDKNIIPWLGHLGGNKEQVPAVGSYEPDKTMTILYDINKNKKYGNSHFNSTQYSNRNGLYYFQKNAPNGPGCYYHDKFVEQKQISAAFNSTADRFFLGGKNNTRNLREMPKKTIDVIMKNNDRENTMGLTEKMPKEKGIEKKSTLSYSCTPNIVGPGSYNFLPEVYPWVKQSYNSKFM